LCFDLSFKNWYYEGGKFEEKLAYEDVFQNSHSKVEEQAQLMQKYFESAKYAYESGKKQEAKQLSEKGKEHQVLMNKYKKEAALEVFRNVNKGYDEHTIDLHGQQVEEAKELLCDRLNKVKKGTLTVITGAGNHAKAGAKIKPEVIRVLDQLQYSYTDVNAGTLLVKL
jgi:DNA-nicking Smr family endonuclease